MSPAFLVESLHDGGIVQGATCIPHMQYTSVSTGLLINARYHLAYWSEEDALADDSEQCTARFDTPMGIDAVVHLDAAGDHITTFLAACSTQSALHIMHITEQQLHVQLTIPVEHPGPGTGDPRPSANVWKHTPPAHRPSGALLSNALRTDSATHVAVCVFDDVVHMIQVNWNASQPSADTHPLSLFRELLPAFRGARCFETTWMCMCGNKYVCMQGTNTLLSL